MKKPRLPQGRRGLLLLVTFALLTAAALAYFQFTPDSSASPLPDDAGARMLQQLDASKQPWLENRRDLSTLLSDLRSQTISSAALSKSAIYVSRTDGLNYWVPDQSGHVAQLLLDHYAQITGPVFPLALFEPMAKHPGTSRYYPMPPSS